MATSKCLHACVHLNPIVRNGLFLLGAFWLMIYKDPLTNKSFAPVYQLALWAGP